MSAQSNRDKMPNVAKMVDDVRAIFGPGVKVVYAREGEYELGKRPDPANFVTPIVSLHIPSKEKRKGV